jgi:phospholipase/lecithinase/hemolysin
MRQKLLCAGAVVASCLISPQAIAANFSQMYVFGDSLSETGNIFTLTGGVFPSAPPYTPGRFSNGDIWIDYLGDQLGLTPTPSFQTQFGVPATEGVSFALGGSTTGAENIAGAPLFGLTGQLASFLSSISGGQADANALYVLWVGANDYLPPGSFPGSNTFIPAISPEQPIANLSRAIDILFNVGARRFLVANLPDLGEVPPVTNTPLKAPLNAITAAHNAQLDAALMTLNQTRPGIDIQILDVNGLFDQAIAGDLGFTVLDTPCLNEITGTVCSNPDEYLFWDNLHPTTKAHEAIGNLALATLHPPSDDPVEPPMIDDPVLPEPVPSDPQDIPEPGMGVMAIAALGLGALTNQLRVNLAHRQVGK